MGEVAPKFSDFIEKHCSSKAVFTRQMPCGGKVILHLSGVHRYLTRNEIWKELHSDFVELVKLRFGLDYTVWCSSEEGAFVFQNGGSVSVEVRTTSELFWTCHRELMG